MEHYQLFRFIPHSELASGRTRDGTVLLEVIVGHPRDASLDGSYLL